MIYKDKELSNELRKNIILSDLGDSVAKHKVEVIWETLTKRDFTDKSDPILVIYPNGTSEVYASKIKTQKECKIGYDTLQNCINTGQPDRLGRCYDYLIYENEYE